MKTLRKYVSVLLGVIMAYAVSSVSVVYAGTSNPMYNGFYYLNGISGHDSVISVTATSCYVNNYYVDKNGSGIIVTVYGRTDNFWLGADKFTASFDFVYETNGHGVTTGQKFPHEILTKNIRYESNLFGHDKIHVTDLGKTYTKTL